MKEVRVSLSFLAFEFAKNLISLFIYNGVDVDIDNLLTNFSAEEAKKLPKMAICIVDNKEKIIFSHVINDQVGPGSKQKLFNNAFNSARQAIKFKNDTISLKKK